MNLKELAQCLEHPYKNIAKNRYTMAEKILKFDQLLDNEIELKNKYIIIGFPDHIERIAQHDCGRTKQGLKAFRHSFYHLFDTVLREYNPITQHPFPPGQKKAEKTVYLAEKFVDAGDIRVANSMAETHENLAVVVEFFLKAGAQTIFILGSGHNLTYPAYKGHVAYKKNEIIPIINFDAHLNLHPVENAVVNSNTAFYRIIEDFSANILDGKALLEIGIQRECNPHFLYEFAVKKQISVVEYLPLLNLWRDLQQAHTQLPLEHVRDHIDDCAEYGFNRYTGSIHLSLCLDAFGQSLAPGSSGSTHAGMQLHDILNSLAFFSKARACRVVDIAGLCPLRDDHEHTACLGASLVYRFALVREEYAPR